MTQLSSNAGADAIAITLAAARGDTEGVKFICGDYENNSAPLIKAFAALVWVFAKNIASTHDVSPEKILVDFRTMLGVWDT